MKMKRKPIFILLTLCLTVGLSPWAAMPARAAEPGAVSPIVMAAYAEEAIAYVDADGKTQECTSYTLLTGSNSGSVTTLGPGWYVVKENVSYPEGLIFYGQGTVNLILVDGCNLDAGNNSAIGGILSNPEVNIYGQPASDNPPGSLTATGKVGLCTIRSINSKNLTVCGGSVTFNGEENNSNAISIDGKLTVKGGNVTANANSNGKGIEAGSVEVSGGAVVVNSDNNYRSYAGIQTENSFSVTGGSVTVAGEKGYGNYGIYAGTVSITGGTVYVDAGRSSGIRAHGDGNTITLGWTGADDSIYANSYAGTVTVVDGKTFATDDATPAAVSGAVTDPDAINGKTLTPAYTVNIENTANGTVTASTEAVALKATGDARIVTLTAAPVSGYGLSSLTYVPEGGTAQTIEATLGEDGKYTGAFTMPDKAVTVAATFARLLTAEMIADIPAQTYMGSTIEPTVTVKYGDTTLAMDTDYTVSYSSNTNAAESTAANAPTVTVTGMGLYTGTVSKTFTINPRTVTAPSAVTGLKWTGGELTGVASGEGYSVTNGAKTDVGDYTATATLTDTTNYRWSDNTTAAKRIAWRIGRADGPAAPTGLEGVAPGAALNDGRITGVTDKMEYSADGRAYTACTGEEITGLTAGEYYVRAAQTATHEAGAAATVSVPAYVAPPWEVGGEVRSGGLAVTAVRAQDDAWLIAAVYDGSGRLAAIRIVSLKDIAGFPFDTGLTVTSGDTCKLMLLDLTSCAPLCFAWSGRD